MAKKIKPTVTAELLSELYSDYLLRNNHPPASIYVFCKDNDFEEAEFYKLYASFEAIEEAFFKNMCEYCISLIQKDENYGTYDASQKLSSFYFTFIEMATANRSMVVKLLKESPRDKAMKKLASMRESYINFVTYVLEKPIKIDLKNFAQLQDKALQEASWLQFMSIIKFWLDDTSSGFEKTDVFIEKSVKASFDLAYNLPTKSILDFGKFLWQENFGSFNGNKP